MRIIWRIVAVASALIVFSTVYLATSVVVLALTDESSDSGAGWHLTSSPAPRWVGLGWFGGLLLVAWLVGFRPWRKRC